MLLAKKYLRGVKKIAHNEYNKSCVKKLKKKLTNSNFSIISSTCVGGIIYHRLGEKFLSPTINLWFDQKDFLKLVLDLKRYMNMELEFVETEYNYPVGQLDDIRVYFNHSKTKDDAKAKWDERKKRINYDNLFIIMHENDGITYEDMEKIDKLECNGAVVFTNKEYKDVKCALFLPPFKNDAEVGYVLKENLFTGKYLFENYFDYVKWLNCES